MVFQFNPGCNCCGPIDPSCTVFSNCCTSYTPAAQVTISIPSVLDVRSGNGSPGFCDDTEFPCVNVCEACDSIAGDYIATLITPPGASPTWEYTESAPPNWYDIEWDVPDCTIGIPLYVQLFTVRAELLCLSFTSCIARITVEMQVNVSGYPSCLRSGLESWTGLVFFGNNKSCSGSTFSITNWPQNDAPSFFRSLVCMKTGTGTASFTEI